MADRPAETGAADPAPPFAALRGAFPFCLAATSFVYPDHYVPNVRRIGPLLDGIELLCFESAAGNLPTPDEIAVLAELGRRHGIVYNVHLPTDVSLADPDPARRREAARSLARVWERVRPLDPVTHTLHLPCAAPAGAVAPPAGWLAALDHGLAGLNAMGIDFSALSVETLLYPFSWLDPLLDAHPLAVCLDIGHLLLSGQDPLRCFDRYRDRLAVVHLHGVHQGRDHHGLDRLPAAILEPFMQRLRTFDGVVSLEVFSLERLVASVGVLRRMTRLRQGYARQAEDRGKS